MESYLREKRDAILEDRKNHFGDLKVMLTNGGVGNNGTGKDMEIDDDQKSCLQ